MRVSHSTCIIGSLQVVTSLFHASLLASLLFGSNQLLPGTDAAEVIPTNEQSQPNQGRQHQQQHESKPVIHKQMNENDLRKVFQVQSHDEVPEYDIVHLRVINKRQDTLFDVEEDGGNDYLSSKRSKRSNSNNKDDDDTSGTLKYVYLKAFGDGMHLNLRRNDDLHHKLKSIKLITAESSTSESRWAPRSHEGGVRYSESMIQGEGDDSVGVPYHDDQHVAAVIVSTGPGGQVTLVSYSFLFLTIYYYSNILYHARVSRVL